MLSKERHQTATGPVPAQAKLLLPPKELANFIAAAVFRDTRGASLTDRERLSYFPATPLLTITVVAHGQLHMEHGVCDVDDLKAKRALPTVCLVGPSDTPIVSWSPGELVAVTLAIYPDAWTKVAGDLSSEQIPTGVARALRHITSDIEIDAAFARACAELAPIWKQVRSISGLNGWAGSDRISDWTRHLVARSFMAQPDRSLRGVERLMNQWTGRSRATLAETALDADFADQSHMGRHLKRATGFSPTALNNRIAHDEAFWCYRLLGERF